MSFDECPNRPFREIHTYMTTIIIAVNYANGRMVKETTLLVNSNHITRETGGGVNAHILPAVIQKVVQIM